jgi:type II secretory pathway component PulF
MAQFTYIARSRSGERIEGSLEANDRRAAALQIERMGHVPVTVKDSGLGVEKKGRKKISFKLEFSPNRKPKMKMREVLFFSREMSDLLASGMTLGNALNTLANRESGGAQDIILGSLRDEIIQGRSFSDALGDHPETFSALYISLIRAGEASGSLPESLESVCFHYERVQEAKEKVMMALTYPSIVLIFGTVTIVFSMIFVVPRFTSIFDELGSTLPLPTRMLIWMSDVLVSYGLIIGGFLTALFVMFRRWLKTDPGTVWGHKRLLQLPVVRSIVTANAYAHFSRTLGALLRNGVPVLQALSIVEDTVGNVVIAHEIHDARERVTDGSSISGPLAEGKVFPRLLTDMLAVGEQSGDMSGALVHITRRYDTELDRNVKVLTTVLEPILILFIAVMVGFVAISMLLAVFDLTSGLG